MKTKIQNKLILIFASFFLLLSACTTKPLPINLDQAPTKLAIASQIIPGEVMIISVTKSFSALVNTTDSANQQNAFSNFLVDHARVILKANGTTYKLQKFAPGFYGNILAPTAAGSTFDIEVYDTTTGLSVSSSTRYMPAISIDSIWIEEKRIKVLNNTDTQFFANLKFTDPAGSNFYMINAYKNFSFAGGGLISGSLFGGNSNSITAPLSDAGFENENHVHRFQLNGFKAGDTATLTLTNIENDYYTYLVERQRAQRNGLSIILGEPVTYTTNIKNGFGFFTAHVPSIRIKIIPK